MITLIGGEKGGTGKSTLATNLAVWLAREGRDVLLLDTDVQATCARWESARSALDNDQLVRVHCVQRRGNVAATVHDLSSRYDEVVIDAGGQDSEELRSALAVADWLVTPLLASQPDMWTAEHVLELVRLARALNPDLAARFLVSRVPTNPQIDELQEALEALEEFADEMPVTSGQVYERKVYRDALKFSRGVVELKNPKATAEIEKLAREIYHGIRDEIPAETTDIQATA